MTFNPTAGIPKTSYNEKSAPSYDNVTWFSTIQPKESPMNEFTNLNSKYDDAPIVTGVPLTDEEMAKLLAAKAVISTDDADETEEDRVLN